MEKLCCEHGYSYVFLSVHDHGRAARRRRTRAIMSTEHHRSQALLMSLGAGLATGVGASLCLCTSELNKRLLACTMAFSAGVMIYVSLSEVLAVATEYFSKSGEHDESAAYRLGTASLFAGVLLMALVDVIVHRVFEAVEEGDGEHGGNRRTTEQQQRKEPPFRQAQGDPSFMRLQVDDDEHSHQHGRQHGHEHGHDAQDELEGNHDHCHHDHGHHDHSHHDHDHASASIMAVASMRERRKMLVMAMVVSAAIILHNFPEGAATYVASFESLQDGAPLAFAIAVHNIPEGLAVAMPVLHATGSKARAIGLGALSGMAEPLGALLASLIANESSQPDVFGALFGLTAGMMLFVCVAELLPAAYAEKTASTALVALSFFVGCAVMATSLMLGA